MTLYFQEAERLLGKRATKKLSGNTYLRRMDADTFAVCFHRTNVVLIRADGTWTLDTRGYHTPTTKERIKRYSPANVFQNAGNWFILGYQGVGAVPFFDGITVDQFGRAVPSDPAERAALADQQAGADDTPSRTYGVNNV